ncbi:hypothetical protein L198_08211 [Cryptococcus wingfieldii CBS 7118]|uniref:F-box domain-containing protein n=1 Tax=Cryptococcus wingfieldii CBS 7118 TaxID=1295528 RepID=A0A1E3HF15_9TREE|nr:hypothetical protein L198_08211 [Cryptococcus wingfieldii CBS 7118]ODN74904.1 hypothetical protein L198_08211 [Cryptococcus wingfieldii CBS 7118]
MTEADPSSPQRLPEDVMYVLLGHVGATASPPALATFLRVSRYFHKRLIPFLYISPTLTQANVSGFFDPLFDTDTIDDDEREHWWQGDPVDKKSAVARRLAMLGHVQCVIFEDYATEIMCNSAVSGFLAQGLDSPPMSWYGYTSSSRDDSSPARRLLFYGRAPTLVHLSHKYLGNLAFEALDDEDRRVQTFQSMLGPFGVLSIQQPADLRGLHRFYVPNYLAPICRRVEPFVLVINDYDNTVLSEILSPSQRGIAMRLRGSMDSRSIAQTDEVVEFLSEHMKLTREPLFYIIYNFSMDEAIYDHCNGKRVRNLILKRAFAAASQSPQKRIVRLEVIMQGPQSNAATVERMRYDIFELMKKG